MSRTTCLPLCAITAALFTASAAYSQDANGDAKAIAAYRLTADRLRQVINVNRAILQTVLQEPKVQESLSVSSEIEALSRRDELTAAEQRRLEQLEARQMQLEAAVDNPLGGDVESLAEMEARIRRYPPMIEALKREGLAPREYSIFWMAFLQAALAHRFQKSGMMQQLPPDVNPANVKFVAEHQPEIEAMQKEFEGLSRRRQ